MDILVEVVDYVSTSSSSEAVRAQRTMEEMPPSAYVGPIPRPVLVMRMTLKAEEGRIRDD